MSRNNDKYQNYNNINIRNKKSSSNKILNFRPVNFSDRNNLP